MENSSRSLSCFVLRINARMGKNEKYLIKSSINFITFLQTFLRLIHTLYTSKKKKLIKDAKLP